MRILITGAAGMLGQDLDAAARAAGHDVHALGRGALDITDPVAVAAALGAIRPDAVINCAAWTDVDGAESQPAEALLVNGTGAGVLARGAAAAGAVLVQISTDYVFDGRGQRPYVETDPVAPLSSYGRSKLAGEREVAAAGPEHLIVRTSWLFGTGGGNFVATMLRLGRERPRVAVVTDQIGRPTWTGHLALGLLELLDRGDRGVVHLAGGGAPVSWHGLTVEAFAQAGITDRVVEETTTAAFPRPAPRPAWSVLDSERPDPVLLPDWREGVTGYLAALSLPVEEMT